MHFPGSDSSVYSKQHTRTVGHMASSAVRIVYKTRGEFLQNLSPAPPTSCKYPQPLSTFSNALIMRFPTVIGVLVVSAAALVGAAPTGGVLNGIDIESALIGLSRRNCRKGSCVTRAANDIVNVVDRCNSALALVPVGPCNDEDADALVGFTTVSLCEFSRSDTLHSPLAANHEWSQ